MYGKRWMFWLSWWIYMVSAIIFTHFAPKSPVQATWFAERTFSQRRRVCAGMKGADRKAVIEAVAGLRHTA